ncbi:uncharacterized protein [Malus domestica]|uniref:uncharacterized protein n=1 Tax=Malus domestica TaxID=3750 RepID=UPI003975F360
MFIKKSHSEFAIVAIYVDDMNLIGTPAKLEEISTHLKLEFEMKDLGETQYYLYLKIEHCSDEILVHQSKYTQKVLCRFNEDKAKLSSTHMTFHTLDVKRDPFCPNEDKDEILEPKGYVFTVKDTAISLRSTKQMLVVTSSNHTEILALHEASRECFWLKAVIEHIRSTNGLTSIVDLPTTIFEDNKAFIEQLKKGYIKGDNTKYISRIFFYSHQQQ